MDPLSSQFSPTHVGHGVHQCRRERRRRDLDSQSRASVASERRPFEQMAGRSSDPVLFGENGGPTVSYEIDAFHDEYGIVVEVDAGREPRGNSSYRDIRPDLADCGCSVPRAFAAPRLRHNSGGRGAIVKAYTDAGAQVDAVYASERLKLPFGRSLARRLLSSHPVRTALHPGADVRGLRAERIERG